MTKKILHSKQISKEMSHMMDEIFSHHNIVILPCQSLPTRQCVAFRHIRSRADVSLGGRGAGRGSCTRQIPTGYTGYKVIVPASHRFSDVIIRLMEVNGGKGRL